MRNKKAFVIVLALLVVLASVPVFAQDPINDFFNNLFSALGLFSAGTSSTGLQLVFTSPALVGFKEGQSYNPKFTIKNTNNLGTPALNTKIEAAIYSYDAAKHIGLNPDRTFSIYSGTALGTSIQPCGGSPESNFVSSQYISNIQPQISNLGDFSPDPLKVPVIGDKLKDGFDNHANDGRYLFVIGLYDKCGGGYTVYHQQPLTVDNPTTFTPSPSQSTVTSGTSTSGTSIPTPPSSAAIKLRGDLIQVSPVIIKDGNEVKVDYTIENIGGQDYTGTINIESGIYTLDNAKALGLSTTFAVGGGTPSDIPICEPSEKPFVAAQSITNIPKGQLRQGTLTVRAPVQGATLSNSNSNWIDSGNYILAVTLYEKCYKDGGGVYKIDSNGDGILESQTHSRILSKGSVVSATGNVVALDIEDLEKGTVTASQIRDALCSDISQCRKESGREIRCYPQKKFEDEFGQKASTTTVWGSVGRFVEGCGGGILVATALIPGSLLAGPGGAIVDLVGGAVSCVTGGITVYEAYKIKQEDLGVCVSKPIEESTVSTGSIIKFFQSIGKAFGLTGTSAAVAGVATIFGGLFILSKLFAV